ncbi:MAG: HEAT repeat domain-containing protein [Planctomycetota bacterium]|nr:HEAT repeat domain-containing protein [Planctomycetota bacterium]
MSVSAAKSTPTKYSGGTGIGSVMISGGRRSAGVSLGAWVLLAFVGPLAAETNLDAVASKLADPDGRDRHEAARALVAAEVPGWQAMVKFLRGHKELHRAVTDTLVELGPSVVPAMFYVAWMDSGRSNVNEAHVSHVAGEVLERLGPKAETATVEALSHPVQPVRVTALQRLCSGGKRGQLDQGAIARMVGLVDGPDTNLACFAAHYLAEFRPVPILAVPALVRALKGKDKELRMAAAEALVAMEVPEADQAVPVFIEALDNPNSDAGRGAIQCLETLGPRASSAAPALGKLLVGKDRGALNWGRFRALAAIGPSAIPIVPFAARRSGRSANWLFAKRVPLRPWPPPSQTRMKESGRRHCGPWQEWAPKGCPYWRRP